MRDRLIILILCSAAALWSVSCSSDNSSSEASGYPGRDGSVVSPSVEAVQTRYGSLPLRERISGTVEAFNQVELYPQMSGRVARVYVQNGDRVQQGTPLVKLEDRQYREQLRQAEAGLQISKARLSQAKAQLTEVEARYNRTKQLASRDLSSDQELQQAEAELQSARADVELAKAQVQQAGATVEERREMLDRTVINAPVDGVVGRRNAEVGMQVSPSTRLFMVGNLDKLKIRVPLTGEMLQYVEKGQTALIYPSRSEEDSSVLEAQVSRISPFLNTVSRSSEAEIEVDNVNDILKPGMFVSVDILYGESEKATLIPTSALYSQPNTSIEGVYVVTTLGSEVTPVDPGEDNDSPLTEPLQVQFKPVDVLARGRMQIGVSGLRPNQWVVTVGQNLLTGEDAEARVRTVSWERVMALQGLQRQDLLYQILKNQQQTEEEPS